MINWKVLSGDQLDTLNLHYNEGEVVLVDPTANYDSIALFMFDAQEVFSEKQLGKYKRVTPTEFKIVEDKLYELGRHLSWDGYTEEKKDDGS